MTTIFAFLLTAENASNSKFKSNVKITEKIFSSNHFCQNFSQIFLNFGLRFWPNDQNIPIETNFNRFAILNLISSASFWVGPSFAFGDLGSWISCVFSLSKKLTLKISDFAITKDPFSPFRPHVDLANTVKFPLGSLFSSRKSKAIEIVYF